MSGLPPRPSDSGSLAQQVHRATRATGGGARLSAGLVTAVDDAGDVTVNVDGVDLTSISLPGMPLQAGDRVKVLRQGGTCYVVGLVATQARPATGVVASVPSNSSTIVVTTTLGSLSCGWAAPYAPAAGDAVWIAWLGSTPVVIGKQGTSGSPPAPAPTGTTAPAPPPPQQTTTSGTTSFIAAGSGTFRSGEWVSNSISNGNVMQGDYGFGANSGAWFYNGKIHSTLKGATVKSAQIWLGRTQGGVFAAQTVHLSRVSQDNRPAGALTFDGAHQTDSIALSVGQRGWFTLPKAIAQALVDSGGSLGVTSANPYLRLLGRPNDTRAGQLKITWTRTS